jgi:lipopolysaccharide transport system ATP-binding protein
MSADYAIKVDHLSKCYHIYDRPRDRLKQFFLPRLRGVIGAAPERYYSEFWALKDVSLDIRRGETVGIIGRNGSGKSTLLQLICGILAPTLGSVVTRGRISALLELGAGFNPEFTGRENVYLYASILGLPRAEIDARFDSIESFADIGEFIDRPVKHYSSGMVVRLAFSVQAQVDPSILIVDEALAVGDVRFQAKCFNRLSQLQKGGTSILLVTHSTEQIVTHCSRAFLLDAGRILEEGDPNRVSNCYLDLIFGKAKKVFAPIDSPHLSELPASPVTSTVLVARDFQLDGFVTRSGYNPCEYRWGDGAAKINDYFFASEDCAYPAALTVGQKCILEVLVTFHEDVTRPIFGMTIKTKEGVVVYGTNSERQDIESLKVKGAAGRMVIVEISFICRFAPGDYFISLGIATRQAGEVVPHDRRYDAIHIHVLPRPEFFGLVDIDCAISSRDAGL